MQKKTDLILYADDTAVITGSKIIELLNNHQLALKNTNGWIKENKIVFNVFMFFSLFFSIFLKK